MGVSVVLTGVLTCGSAAADDLGPIGHLVQVGDPSAPGDPLVPGLGNVAGFLDSRPAPQGKDQQRPHTTDAGTAGPAAPAVPASSADNGNGSGGGGADEGEPGPVAANEPSSPDAGDPEAPQQPADPAAGQAPSRAEMESQVLSATNQARAAAGCTALIPDWHLAQSAQEHSDDMAAHSYFSHSSLDGRTFDRRIHDTGYPGPIVGENIASGFDSAPEVQNAWMESPAHRRNILDCDYRSVGIGYEQQGGYWTVDFGS